MRRWLIVVLAFTAIMLNYVDRQIIALLKPTLQVEFGWTNRDYSHMASTFQFSAALAFLGAGWFIDRIGLRRGFAVGVGTWSLAGMAHALVASVGGFVAARAVLGAAEAIGTPAQVKTAATYFPPDQRSMMLGIGNMASNLGAVIAPLAIPPLALALGWRAAFLITGGMGLLWVVVWLLVPPPGHLESAAIEGARVSWPAMLRDRRQWALVAAKTFSDEVWWFLLFFTPDLFNRRFGLSQGALGVPVAFIYTMAALGALSGGLLSSRLLRSGMGTDRARKASLLVYALLILPLPLLVFMHSVAGAAAMLGLALFAHQGFSTNVFGMAADMFPAQTVGTAVSIAAFAGNISGMAIIELAGWSLDKSYGYAPLLFLCGVSYSFALVLVQLIVPKIVRPQTSTLLADAEPSSFGEKLP